MAQWSWEVAFRGADAPSVDVGRRIFPFTKVDGQPLGFGRGLSVLVNWALDFALTFGLTERIEKIELTLLSLLLVQRNVLTAAIPTWCIMDPQTNLDRGVS
jgi:hypothetical protein